MIEGKPGHRMKGGNMDRRHNDGYNPKMSVLIQPNIGLDGAVRHSVVVLLNTILADEFVLATKTRSAQWNGCGADFFELHTLFKSQYQLLNHICDEMAERARMLGDFAIGSLEEFLQHTRLEEQAGDVPDVLHLLADHEAFIRFLREDSRKCSEEYEDEGTFELLIRTMRRHEKIAWMLRSLIETKALNNTKPVS
jgi:starvation-inducible DNA-binding protein